MVVTTDLDFTSWIRALELFFGFGLVAYLSFILLPFSVESAKRTPGPTRHIRTATLLFFLAYDLLLAGMCFTIVQRQIEHRHLNVISLLIWLVILANVFAMWFVHLHVRDVKRWWKEQGGKDPDDS